MKKTMLILFICLILGSCKDKPMVSKPKRDGDRYVGKWERIDKDSVTITLKRGGNGYYIMRVDNMKENGQDLLTYKNGCFFSEDTNEKVLFANGDTLESLKYTYKRVDKK